MLVYNITTGDDDVWYFTHEQNSASYINIGEHQIWYQYFLFVCMIFCQWLTPNDDGTFVWRALQAFISCCYQHAYIGNKPRSDNTSRHFAWNCFPLCFSIENSKFTELHFFCKIALVCFLFDENFPSLQINVINVYHFIHISVILCSRFDLVLFITLYMSSCDMAIETFNDNLPRFVWQGVTFSLNPVRND